jgi:hypothetical chaperone protein
MRRSVGLDFGTTNSAIGVTGDDGNVTLARFDHKAGSSDTFRSILYFHPDVRDARGRLQPEAGARAIEHYLDAGGTGRLIQSLKSYLADRLFMSTSIFSRTHTLPELLTLLLQQIRARAEEKLGPLGPRIVVGRPVHFSNADTPEDDAFAVGRLRGALEAAGFQDIELEYEPVAAAYYYERQLDHDELVLIADFGGGTSDFSLIEVGPSKRGAGRRKILGNDGVGLAGDALDSQMLHRLVAPALGLGSTYRSMFGVELPVPVWIYAKLRKWHHLSFLKSKKTMDLLDEILDQSDDPEKIRALLHILDHDLGYQLYRSIERAKVDLSSRDETTFVFHDDPLVIEQPVTRAQFEGWIAEETASMATCVDRLLATAGVDAKDVDQVFMTGGTSFVPAVRHIFEQRFGATKIRAGGEMISVATGLALRANDEA